MVQVTAYGNRFCDKNRLTNQFVFNVNLSPLLFLWDRCLYQLPV